MNFKKLFLNYWPLFVILVISGFLFTFRLGRDLLWDWDECLYSVYSNSMKQTGNYLNHVWNGYIDLQKPPLYTWMLQISTLFGTNEFTLRIISVIGGLLILITVYDFSKKYFSEIVALLSTLLLLVGEVFVIYSMKMNTDIPYVLFIFIAFYFWVLSLKKKNYLYISSLLFALAVMVKGLSVASFLIAIFLSIFLNPTKQKFWNFFKMGFVMILLILPWHILAYLKYGNDFVQVYFVENLIQRARNPIEFHYGGRLFYIKQLFSEYMPWFLAVFILPVWYLLNLKKYLNFKKIKAELKDKELIFTILLLIVIPFAVITNVQTKIPWYIMPIYPFLSIFLAYSLVFLLDKLRLKNVLLVVIIFTIVADSGFLILKETRFFDEKRNIGPRNEVAIKSSQYTEKEIYYLVAQTERTAKALLDQSPNLQIRSTFVYGGNPCAVYYSGKKVNYYYSVEEFKKQLGEKGLYLLENKDLQITIGLPTKILYQNKEFTLFERTQ